ncbi:unnamed protein product [Anisakis simplex]|uniref:Transposase n=1 Tax=Anisakis simplex TaxID=6269 RepID=A0A0M3JI40_ANISI|nr:unnamed protein product [Anisakis simplex]
MTQSSTIFSLNKDDLTAILMTLKPSLNEDQLSSLSVIDIRSQITEWLLLNGLSTMHSFVKNEADNEWKVPDKVDCISCGKYRVGAKGNRRLKKLLHCNISLEPPYHSCHY